MKILGIRVEKDGKEIDSCGGFIGDESVVEYLKTEHLEIFQGKLEVVGEAKHLLEGELAS